MRADSELRSEFRSALEAVTPPAPWLGQTVTKELRTKLATRRADRAGLQLRLGLNVIAILVLIGVAVAAVGVYLTMHQAVMPAHPGAGRVFFPTKMVTASTGWLWVDPSELLRTTDGGAHWTDVTPPSLPDRIVSYTEPYFLLDATHAWIAQSGQGAVGTAGPYITTSRTSDGGKTWQVGASIGAVPAFGASPQCGGQLLPCSAARENQVRLFPQLFFIDQNHGWLLLPTQGASPTDYSMPTLYSTDDGGVHWKITSSVAWTVQAPITTRQTMVFSSLITGWILGTEQNLLVTHDGGVTWQIQPLPIALGAGGGVGTPMFFDPLHGLIVAWASSASPAVLLLTSDGGSTWIVRSLPWEAGIGIEFADANHGWTIAGPAALFDAPAAVPLPLYKTDDGGLTWVPVPTNILLRTPGDGPIGPFHFVDRNNGLMVRYAYQSNDFSQLLKTTDGGRTWTVVVETPRKLRLSGSHE